MIEFSNYINEGSLVDRTIQIIGSFFFTFIRKVIVFLKIGNSKVLIISLNKLGDTVFTIPAINAIKNKFDQPLTIVCYEESKLIYEAIFNDFQFVVLSNNDFYFDGRIANSKSRRKIKNINAGIIIDLTFSIKSSSLIFNNRAKKIVGSNDKYFNKIYTDFIQQRKSPHLIDIYLDVAKRIVEINNEIELKEYKIILNKNGYILIHPFAGWKAKEWNLNKYIELAQSLNKVYDCKIIIPKECIEQDILSGLKSLSISFLISNGINDLIDAVKNCSVIIGNDSSAIYIANLLGKPTFTIYGPTNPRFSLPFGELHDFIQKEIKCSPEFGKQYCFTDAGRKCPSFECMNLLSLEEVNQKVNLFLDKIGLTKNYAAKSATNF
ncbi:MAG: glycosyltransferase family 9 protein [Ignavibacteriaceae bacterium]